MNKNVLNVTFEVPSWVKAGVDSGELHVFGGVVRDDMGQIAHHLKEAVRTSKNSNRNKLVFMAGMGLVLLLAGGIYYAIKKLKPKEEQLLIHQLQTVDNNILNYCSHDNFAALSRSDIEKLINSLEAFG